MIVLSIRVGQLGVDLENFTNTTSGGLINGTFGWASILAGNMTSGGPAYPLAAPGVRVAVKPTDQLTCPGAVFSGDPAGQLQRCSAKMRSVWHQVQLHLAARCGWANCNTPSIDGNATGLASAYKLGGWYATTGFPTRHFGTDTRAPSCRLRWVDDRPIYQLGPTGAFTVVADQMIWRGPASASAYSCAAVFPAQDRNLISFYVDGGIGIKGRSPIGRTIR